MSENMFESRDPADASVQYGDRLYNLWGEAYVAIISGEPEFAIQKMELREGGEADATAVVMAAFEYVKSKTVLEPRMPQLIYESPSGAVQPIRNEGRLSRYPEHPRLVDSMTTRWG